MKNNTNMLSRLQGKPLMARSCNSVIIMQSKNYYSSQTNCTPKSTETWCVDGLINFEEPFSGLKEMSFNPVSYSAKTNDVQ